MREDFYYRICVFPIEIPPLRERAEDVPALATHLLGAAKTRAEGGRKISGFTPEAMRRLASAPWPGNVRELRNAVEYACVVARGDRIGPDDLPPDLEKTLAPAPPRAERPADPAAEARRVLDECGGKVGEAASRLGISRVTLWRRLRAGGSGRDRRQRR